MNCSRWYKVGWFWSGGVEVPQEEVFLEVQAGRLQCITTAFPGEYADWSHAAVLPPLVNAHCHLEFSQLKAPLQPALPFSAWIGRTVATRRANADPAAAIQQGLHESATAGVRLLAEVVTLPESLHAVYDSTGVDLAVSGSVPPPELTLFQEFLAFNREQADEGLNRLRQFLGHATAGSPRGIAPHAPYTVCPEYFRDCVDVVVESEAAVMLHLAETRAELELLASGEGELVEMLRGLDLWQPLNYAHGLRPLDYLREMARAPRGLIAHGNYLTREEQELLAEAGVAVVYCPRTHAFFGHEPHPFRELRARGVRVCLGTDGRGSNPDLDVWQEVRFLRQHAPSVPPLELLGMATIEGGAALGQELELVPGSPARWTVLLPGAGQPSKISDWEDLFARQSHPEIVMLEDALC